MLCTINTAAPILFPILFYVLGAVIIIATGLAITRRHLVHAIVYLVISFIGTALLFFLLGAPFLAALEVIIYAGAIMVLFLFIIMMLKIEPPRAPLGGYLRQWLPALCLVAVSLAVTVILVSTGPSGGVPLCTAMASPLEFGRFLFQKYWFAVEIASYLFFVALVGAWYLGRREGKLPGRPAGD
jgi:NADH-quinone oxidoreductase subunit J